MRPLVTKSASFAVALTPAGLTIATAVGKLPNQLKVTVSVPTNNPWGGLVGYGATTIVRSATAEYELPQNLGSPQNIYGNDPESAAVGPRHGGGGPQGDGQCPR